MMNSSPYINSGRAGMKADLLLKGDYVNVYTGEILTGNIVVKGSRILCTDEKVEARETIEVDGLMVPGLKDGHIHIESSKLVPSEFARVVVPRGTTSVFADPHEIVNVAGKEGFFYMVEEASQVPLRIHFMVPSCVPASPTDESPNELAPVDVAKLLDVNESVGLAEVMNFPSVIRGEREVLSKIYEARKRRKAVDGHAPLVRGLDLCLYIYRGVESDHESTSSEEALEKLRKGMYVMIREGTASKDMKIIRCLKTQKRRILLVSDDESASDLVSKGHVDYLLRRSLEEGIDPIEAIQMVTINVAERFGLRELDGIAPGRLADLTILRDLKNFEATSVYIGGKLVAHEGKPLFERRAIKRKIGEIKLPALNLDDFIIKASGSKARVRTIELTSSLLTEEREEWLPIEEDVIKASRDTLYAAVVERYGRTGHVGRGFVRGFNLSGAMASTVAHDSHNLIVIGNDAQDMLIASKKLEEFGGGQVIVSEGKVRAMLPLPIGGLMSDLEAHDVARGEEELKEVYHSLGGRLEDPFMQLSFLALPVIPRLKLTPKGLFDVGRNEIVPPVLEVV